MTRLEIEQAFESIRTLFRETDQRIAQNNRRLDQRIAQTDQRIAENNQRLDQRIAENNQRLDQLIAENNRRLDQRIAQTDQRIAQTDQRLDQRSAATEREIKALAAQTRATESLFTSQWGRLLEALVQPGVIALFQARGIAVDRSLERIRIRRDGEEIEIDLLLVDDKVLVVVEVKSTLKVEDVRDLLRDLERFPDFFPEYRGYRRFGAVAALSIDESADRYAHRQGLFVLTLGHEGLVTLRNDDAFDPKDFAAADNVNRP